MSMHANLYTLSVTKPRPDQNSQGEIRPVQPIPARLSPVRQRPSLDQPNWPGKPSPNLALE